MCLAVPGKVVSIEGTNAVVDMLGVKREVSIDLFNDVKIGDYLMVHAGYAIEKVDLEEAERTIELYKELGMILQENDKRD